MGFRGILDRAGNARESGLMKDDLGTLDSRGEGRRVIYIAFDEIKIALDLLEVFAKACGQIVDDSDSGTLPDKLLGKVRKDETGTSGN